MESSSGHAHHHVYKKENSPTLIKNLMAVKVELARSAQDSQSQLMTITENQDQSFNSALSQRRDSKEKAKLPLRSLYDSDFPL